MTRPEILDAAKKCVCGQRETDYGSPERNFERIADLWNAYLGAETVDPVDVAMLLALLKVARIKTGKGTGDSFVDLAGYAACGGEIATQNADAAADPQPEFVKARQCSKCGEVIPDNTGYYAKDGTDGEVLCLSCLTKQRKEARENRDVLERLCINGSEQRIERV